MGQTVVEKIVSAHMTSGPDRALRAGDFVSVRPRHVMTHDNTAAVLNKFEGLGVEAVADPGQPVFALDHEIGNKSEANLKKYARIEAFAAEHGIVFYPAGAGIGHQMMVENGHVVPGSLVVASDSHSNMYGALGALGTPVVRTDAAAIWATGEFWWSIPRTVQVVLEGELRPGVTGKDVILTLCGLYSSGEVLNAAVEFAGPGVASLSMDARFTISNMTTEWGALVGWFPVDDVTLDFLAGRRDTLLGRDDAFARFSSEDLARWREAPPAPDPDASYAARIELDLGAVAPHVAGPDVVQKTAPLPTLERAEIAVHKAYLLSCVNGRYEDLAAAAEVLDGEALAPGVELYVAAASREIETQAKESGIWATFEAVGARFLEPGCGPCIGLGEGLLEAGEVGISATNRNFKGRMGSRDAACYLASPQVVAASAIAGKISGVGEWDERLPERRFNALPAAAPTDDEAVQILDGFPRALTGRLCYLPADNLNTDGIYGKDYTYREDMTREQMAAVVMENYDPGFAAATREGDLVVGGFNFGTGSSREQAVTALQAKGIPLVIAGSFSQTYLRNAFNNGFLCVELPELVEHLRERFADNDERTLIPGDELAIDFAAGKVTLGDRVFSFAPLGVVPQGLVVDGGVENQVRKRLGLV